jgi:hypothetical protein
MVGFPTRVKTNLNQGQTSLRGKLTPTMTRHIRLQRESANKDSAADCGRQKGSGL